MLSKRKILCYGNASYRKGKYYYLYKDNDIFVMADYDSKEITSEFSTIDEPVYNIDKLSKEEIKYIRNNIDKKYLLRLIFNTHLCTCNTTLEGCSLGEDGKGYYGPIYSGVSNTEDMHETIRKYGLYEMLKHKIIIGDIYYYPGEDKPNTIYEWDECISSVRETKSRRSNNVTILGLRFSKNILKLIDFKIKTKDDELEFYHSLFPKKAKSAYF